MATSGEELCRDGRGPLFRDAGDSEGLPQCGWQWAEDGMAEPSHRVGRLVGCIIDLD